jgi:hypothetical protein
MRTMRVLTASMVVVVGLVIAGAASATPPIGDPFNPTFPPAKHLCEQQGGTFEFAGPGAFYVCTGTTDFSKGQLNGARGLCEGGYKGQLFVNTVTDHDYRCQFGS